MLGMLSRVKLMAVAKSMHQFCNLVRCILPGDVNDDVVEAATGFLYLSVSADVFGRSATARIRRVIRRRLKYLSPTEFASRIERLGLQAEAFRLSELNAAGRTDEATAYQVAVNGAIRSMCIEAGLDHLNPEVLRDCFPRFEHAAERIKAHLAGIRRQNRWLIA
jgi:hypothetical protein